MTDLVKRGRSLAAHVSLNRQFGGFDWEGEDAQTIGDLCDEIERLRKDWGLDYHRKLVLDDLREWNDRCSRGLDTKERRRNFLQDLRFFEREGL